MPCWRSRAWSPACLGGWRAQEWGSFGATAITRWGPRVLSRHPHTPHLPCPQRPAEQPPSRTPEAPASAGAAVASPHTLWSRPSWGRWGGDGAAQSPCLSGASRQAQARGATRAPPSVQRVLSPLRASRLMSGRRVIGEPPQGLGRGAGPSRSSRLCLTPVSSSTARFCARALAQARAV